MLLKQDEIFSAWYKPYPAYVENMVSS